MYQLSLVIDDVLVSTNHSHHNFHKTLKLSAQLVKGIPSAEVIIRRGGQEVGLIETGWKGELENVEVYNRSVRWNCRVVTPMNPRADMFVQ